MFHQLMKNAFFLFVFVSLALVGCNRGPTDAKVVGTVTFDGEPLYGAVVRFTPESGGRQSEGFTDRTGRYELRFSAQTKGVVSGKHKVSIRTTPEEYGVEEVKEVEKLPAKYNTDSQLIMEVKRGAQQIDFDLTSK